MKKKVLYIFLAVILLIGICFIVLFVKNILEDNRESKKVMQEIKDIKMGFDDNIDEYNKYRKNLSSIVDDVVIDKFDGAYDTVYLLIGKEEKVVLSVKSAASKLDKYCKGKVFSDSYVNSFCLEYKVSYEEMVNVFLSDVKNINSIIEQYNKGHSNSLKIYSSSIYDYIDYNDDGIYSGKEE